jgi:ribosomal protein S18 acetylase RimI-like enzyme
LSGIPVDVTLRTYQQEDFEALYEIDQACYDRDTAYSRSDLRAYLGFLGSECVVAEVKQSALEKHNESGTGNRIVGFCISAHRGAEGYVITMDIIEEYRRRKIGSALLREVERRLANAGVRWVGLETATDNPAAVAFWQKHGYRARGVRKGYYPRGRDAYSMAKQIAALKARGT